LISSLIEVFGDTAVQAVLSVVHNMFQKGEKNTQTENPWLSAAMMAMDQNDDSDQDESEESKVAL